MKVYIFLLSFLLCASAFSQGLSRTVLAKPAAKSKLQLYVANAELRYERGNDQSLENREPLNFAAAFEKNQFNYLFEYVQFEEGSGNRTSAIQRSHEEASFWLRYHLIKSKMSFVAMSFFGGVGVGAYQDKVKTTLFSAERLDKSEPSLMSGIVVGSQIDALLLGPLGVSLGFEIRSLISGDFDPNPLWSAVGRLGLLLEF